MNISDIQLNKGAALAPMAGISDGAMRSLCERFGAVYTVSEMVSAKAIAMGDKKSLQLLLRHTQGEAAAPYGVQLFGHEPQVVHEAIQRISHMPYDFLDLNMGCPAPKIVGSGDGSALLKDPPAAERFAAAAVKASAKPVTVKLRIGWDDDTMTGLEVAKRCEGAGVQLIAVHARTRAQQYQPGVNYAAVAKIKQAVSIPVIVNGDVDSPAAASFALSQTGCNGVMVGRAAMGNPFLFKEIAAHLQGHAPPAPPTLRLRLQVLEEQVAAMCNEKGEERAMREARKIAAGYMKGLNGAAALRRAAVSLTRYTDIQHLALLAYEYNS